MKWPQLPMIFGWAGLAFADRLKLLALLLQAGAGVAMTTMSAYALWNLAHLKAVWPIFYMGFAALFLIGIIVTGFGALLYKRTVEFEAFGAKFKAQDQEGATAMAQQMKEMTNVQRPNLEDNERGVGRPASGDSGSVAVQRGRDTQSSAQLGLGEGDNSGAASGPDDFTGEPKRP